MIEKHHDQCPWQSADVLRQFSCHFVKQFNQVDKKLTFSWSGPERTGSPSMGCVAEWCMTEPLTYDGCPPGWPKLAADLPLEQFEPDAMRDPAMPAIGDVWCRKQYAHVRSLTLGRVDVTDIQTSDSGDVYVTTSARDEGHTSRRYLLSEFQARHVPRAKVAP